MSKNPNEEIELIYELDELYGCPLGFDDMVVEHVGQELEDMGKNPDDYELGPVQVLCVVTLKDKEDKS
jgi:hypothetical protein